MPKKEYVNSGAKHVAKKIKPMITRSSVLTSVTIVNLFILPRKCGKPSKKR